MFGTKEFWRGFATATVIAVVGVILLTISGCGAVGGAQTPMVNTSGTPVAAAADIEPTALPRATEVAGITKLSDVGAALADAEQNAQPAEKLHPQELGPWAPTERDGKLQGEVFEVTCNETICEETVVQLWWPEGTKQAWGNKEIVVRVPAGLSIEVQHGAGRGWEYPKGYDQQALDDEIAADAARRATDTSRFGEVDIDELIKTRLVTVRFDRR